MRLASLLLVRQSLDNRTLTPRYVMWGLLVVVTFAIGRDFLDYGITYVNGRGYKGDKNGEDEQLIPKRAHCH